MPKKKTPRKPKAAPARRTGATERTQAEEALAARTRQQAALAELGLRALTRIDLATLMDDTVALLSQVLDVDSCKVLELLPDGKALLLRAGVGWKEGYVGHATVDAAANSQAGYTLLHDEPVVTEDLRTETRFSAPPLLIDHGVVSGMSVIIKGFERPFGVLGAHTTSRRTFSSDDINFLQAVANVLAAAIDRKRAEEALRESEERFRTLYTKTPAMVHSLDTDENIVTVSDRWLEVLGYERNEVIGRKSFEFLTAESRQYAETVSLPEFWKTGMVRDVAYQFVKKNGEIVDILLSAVVERDPEGNILRTLAVLDDITERKRAEEALRESEKRFRTLYTKTPAMVHSLDTDGNIVTVSDRWLEVLGYERNEVIGRKSTELLLTAESRRYAETVTLPEFWKTGSARDVAYQFVKKNGEIIDVLLSAFLQRDAEGNVVRTIAVLADITQRKRAEQALREAREALEGRVERKLLQKNPYGLTFREFTVLHHVAAGKADKEIAHELGISPLTVHKHVANILGKMSAASRTEAAARALREGLLD